MASPISPQLKTYLLGQLQHWGNNYPNIPQSVVEHTREVLTKQIDCSLMRSLQEEPDKTPQALDSLFKRTGVILGLTSEQLVRAADWDAKDLDANRFDAMLAELRTVCFLSGEGFSDIRLLRSKGEKKADGTGQREQTKYAIEVTCVAGFKYPGHRKRGQDLPAFLVDRWHEKRSQLEATALEKECQSRVLVYVFVEPGQALVTRDDYLERGLKPAWFRLGCPGARHLAVIAHPSDNCVFPPW